MTSPFFSVVHPQSSETPVIVEVPHAGLSIPAHYLPSLAAPVCSIGRDADLYVDELYADTPLVGATLLMAHVSRYVVDLNRSEADVDSETVTDGSPIARLSHGLVWRLTTEGERALVAPLTRAALNERLDEIYRPYHGALRSEIDRKIDRFGHAVVLAAHSMPSVARSRNGEAALERADVVPGSQGRTTAHERLLDTIDRHCAIHHLSVRHDEPYRGGFTTQHYGRPAERVHVVQVEFARRMYMDEVTLRKRTPAFETLRAFCRSLVKEVGDVPLS